MAKQAEAERENARRSSRRGRIQRRAEAGGRRRAASHRADDIAVALLQTLTEIGVEKNTTIVFPLPLEMNDAFQQAGRDGHSKGRGGKQ